MKHFHNIFCVAVCTFRVSELHFFQIETKKKERLTYLLHVLYECFEDVGESEDSVQTCVGLESLRATLCRLPGPGQARLPRGGPSPRSRTQTHPVGVVGGGGPAKIKSFMDSTKQFCSKVLEWKAPSAAPRPRPALAGRASLGRTPGGAGRGGSAIRSGNRERRERYSQSEGAAASRPPFGGVKRRRYATIYQLRWNEMGKFFRST